MSSILKALRKLEEEKAAMGEGGVDIARDILKRSGVQQSPNPVWQILCVVLVLLLISGGIAFKLLSPQPEPTVDLATSVEADLKPDQVLRVQTPDQSVQPAVAEVKIPLQLPVIPEPEKAEVLEEEPPPARAQAAATRANGLPFLKLTAIAYRANPAERIAILNELPVMQGTSIEGAEVVEILSDRVLLQWQGEQFEQPLEGD